MPFARATIPRACAIQPRSSVAKASAMKVAIAGGDAGTTFRSGADRTRQGKDF